MKHSTITALGVAVLTVTTMALNACSSYQRRELPSPAPTVVDNVVYLPACEHDNPARSEASCVWLDSASMYHVHVSTLDIESVLPACPTEDSVHCVWDSAIRGLSRVKLDDPQRFLVMP